MKAARIVAGILAFFPLTMLALFVCWPSALQHDYSSNWGLYELITLCPGIPILAVNYVLWFEPKIIKSIVHADRQEE